MINLFKPFFRVEEVLNEVRETLEAGWTGMGFKTLKFEEAFKEYTGLPHCHMLNSATSALHLAVHILKKKYKWEDDDFILTTPLTFVSTNMAILYENMTPLFCDIDESLCLSLESLKKTYNESHSGRIKALMFVGMGGNVGNFNEIKKWAKSVNLPIILDAAHMCGTRVDGQHVDPDVEVTCFSFQAVKNLGTADAGAICFKDGEDDKLARKWAWVGIDRNTYERSTSAGAYKWKYGVPNIGYKYHSNSVMGAIGLVGLKYLDIDNAYRRQLASWYDAGLKDNKKIKIVEHKNCESSRHLYQILVPNRDELLMALNQNGIAPGVHYICNTEYKPFSFGKGLCPNADKIQKITLSLPMHVQLTKKNVDYVCEKLNELI